MIDLRLSRFLTLVRKRSRTAIPDDIDPIGIILARVALHPHTPESRALVKACLAVIAGEGSLTELDLWALSSDALGLLDKFAVERLSNRYKTDDLATVSRKLREIAEQGDHVEP